MGTFEERTNTVIVMGPPITRKQIVRTAFYATSTVIATAAIVNVAADVVTEKIRKTELYRRLMAKELEPSQDLQGL